MSHCSVNEGPICAPAFSFGELLGEVLAICKCLQDKMPAVDLHSGKPKVTLIREIIDCKRRLLEETSILPASITLKKQLWFLGFFPYKSRLFSSWRVVHSGRRRTIFQQFFLYVNIHNIFRFTIIQIILHIDHKVKTWESNLQSLSHSIECRGIFEGIHA